MSWGRLIAPLGPAAVATVYRTLGASYRYVVSRPERLDALLRGGPVVLAMWHDQAFAAARFLDRRLHHAGLGLTVIASQSRDGELVARLAGKLGIPVVRGSTSRGGRGAILALHRALVKHGSSPLLAPDGPRGPRHVAKSGAVLLAQFGQAPIVPLAFAAASGLVLAFLGPHGDPAAVGAHRRGDRRGAAGAPRSRWRSARVRAPALTGDARGARDRGQRFSRRARSVERGGARGGGYAWKEDRVIVRERVESVASRRRRFGSRCWVRS